MRIKLTNALSLPHPNNKKRTVLRHAGEVVEVDNGVGDRAIEMGAAEAVDGDESGTSAAEEIEAVAADQGITSSEDGGDSGGAPSAADELPKRPANGASTATWQSYLAELEAKTDDLGPIPVPEGAKRDDLIRIGDERVAEWNEEKSGTS